MSPALPPAAERVRFAYRIACLDGGADPRTRNLGGLGP
jgi:hypothetical protein